MYSVNILVLCKNKVKSLSFQHFGFKAIEFFIFKGYHKREKWPSCMYTVRRTARSFFKFISLKNILRYVFSHFPGIIQV